MKSNDVFWQNNNIELNGDDDDETDLLLQASWLFTNAGICNYAF